MSTSEDKNQKREQVQLVEPPSPAWVKAEADLRREVEQFETTIKAHIEAWEDEVESQLWSAFQNELQRAQRLHLRLLRAVPNLEKEESWEGYRVWRKLQRYRKAVATRILQPLRDHLDGASWGDEVGRLLARQINGLGQHAQAFSESIIIPEGQVLLEPDTADTTLQRWRKGWVKRRRQGRMLRLRLGNHIRALFNRPLYTQAAYHQVIPVRALAAYHVHVRLPREARGAYEALQEVVAQPVAQFEKASTEWSQQVVALERAIDHLAFHSPQVDNPFGNEEAQTKAIVLSREHVEAWHNCTQAFQQALDDLCEVSLSCDVAQDDFYKRLHMALQRDLEQGGTFLLDLTDRTVSGSSSALDQVLESQEAWAKWHHQAIHHLDLNVHILRIQQALLDVMNDGLRRTLAGTLEPIWRAFLPMREVIKDAQTAAQKACRIARDGDDPGHLAETLEAIQQRVLAFMQQTQGDIPSLVITGDVLLEPCSQEWEEVQGALDALPDALTLHVLPEQAEKKAGPDDNTVLVRPRELARRVLQPALPGRLKSVAATLQQQIVKVWVETEAVQNIVQYNVGAAIDELRAPSFGDEEEGSGEGRSGTRKNAKVALDAAEELAVDGLARAAALLPELANSVEIPWDAFEQTLFQQLQTYWERMSVQVRLDVYNEWAWREVQTQLGQKLQRYSERSNTWVAKQRAEIQRLFRVGSRQAQALIRRGQSVVGVSEATDEARLQTLDIIADVGSLHRQLPLVYRKLFSFSSLQEPSLLEGRSRDMVWVRRHLNRWKNQQEAGALALAVPLGSGRASFINALAHAILKDVDVRQVDTGSRVEDEADFVQRLAFALDYDVKGNASLDALEERILKHPRPDPPIACIIPNLEHLMLRAPGGVDVLKRVLIFLSRTDTHLYWITATGPFVWRYIQQSAQGGINLVTRHDLAPISAKVLEAIIVNRHRRSGMALWFRMPAVLPTLTRQRLRRARTPDEEQVILREAYFERLFRLSGSNILLALCYWLRSADFKAKPGTLTVRPLEALDFSFLNSFGRDRAFTLHAFILHNTLTLAEHQRIFRYTEQQSTFVLEALLNLRLIEEAHQNGTLEHRPGYGRIQSGQRYQLRPLIFHPVIEYLRSQNILH